MCTVCDISQKNLMWALLPNLEIVKTIKRLKIGPNCSVANLFNIELY